MKPQSLLDFLSTSVDTCATPWEPFLLSLSPAVHVVLSAIALWVASRARGTSKDALLTSEAVKTLSLLATDSSLVMGDQGRHAAPEKP